MPNEDMDRCIATVQRTIAAAADSAVLLTEASKRWEADKRYFEREQQSWMREKEDFLSQAMEQERLCAAQRKEIKRLTNITVRLNMTLKRRLREDHEAKAKADQAKAAGNPADETGDTSDGTGSEHRQDTGTTAHPSASPSPQLSVAVPTVAAVSTDNTSSRRRSQDRVHRPPQQNNRHSSADEIDTPIAGPGPNGHRIRRRPREWPDIGGGGAVAQDKAAEGKAMQDSSPPGPTVPIAAATSGKETVGEELRPVGGDSGSAYAAAVGGHGDEDSKRGCGGDQESNRQQEYRRSRGGGNRDTRGSVQEVLPRRATAHATTEATAKALGGSTVVGASRSTDTRRRSSEGEGRHGSETTSSSSILREGRDPQPSNSRRSSSGRKRSRLELGDTNKYQAFGDGVGRKRGYDSGRRQVVVEVPMVRRHPPDGTTEGEGHEHQASKAAAAAAAAVAATAAGDRRRIGVNPSAQQSNQQRPFPISRGSSVKPHGFHSSGGGSEQTDTGGGGPKSGGWMQRIEGDSALRLETVPHLAESRERGTAGISGLTRTNDASTSEDSVGKSSVANVGRPSPGRTTSKVLDGLSHQLPRATTPLGTRLGENQAGSNDREGNGIPTLSSGGGVESCSEPTLYPQLTMAAVSPKKKSKRQQQQQQQQQRQRGGNENRNSGKSPAASSREQEIKTKLAETTRIEANPSALKSDDGGDGGRNSNGATGRGRYDGDKPTREQNFAGVGNPYHPDERGLGAGRSEGREERLPKPHKYQEVVRDRARRAAMTGHDCEHCTAYLEAIGGTPGTRQAMLNMCSRHKHDEAHGPPPETPEGFWELSFADSISRKEQERAAATDAQTGGARSAQRQADSLGF